MRLFVAADPREFEGFLPFCTDVNPLELPVQRAWVGNWNNQQMIAVVNGAGAERAGAAAESVLSIMKALAMVNIGFCGALDPARKIGEIVVAESVNGMPARLPETVAPYTRGALVTRNHVAATAAEKQKLFADGFSIVDMEAAGVAAHAARYGVPFYSVRAVSDLAGETFLNDFNAALGPDGRFQVRKLLSGLWSNPGPRLAELLRLQRRCGMASRRLGAFLDTCEF